MMEKQYDLVALGEVMLRLDPGDSRIAHARTFSVWEGGGEYNVAKAFASCFGLRSAVVTALADNPVGSLIRNLITVGGTDTRWLKTVPYDGTGIAVRNGLNFTERGFGMRAPLGCSDRGNSAASRICPDDFDWDQIFSEAKIFHTGGIFASLSESTAATVRESVAAARKRGVPVSFDINYRPSLWKSRGGREAAAAFFEKIIPDVDYLFGSEEDYALMEGLRTIAFPDALRAVTLRYPQLKGAGASCRTVISTSHNRWQCYYADADGVYKSRVYDTEIFDRVGGGDGFVSGFLAAVCGGQDAQTAVEWGAAHGALVMSTPGDTSMATAAEVSALAAGCERRIRR